MISVVIPSYKNPKYLEFCIKSLLKGQTKENEIIVVVDGFVPMYSHLIGTYNQVKWLWLDENQGLPMATNVGVYNATNEKILIINEDNVAPPQWDWRLEDIYTPDIVYAVQQVEPTPSIFNFSIVDCGDSTDTFDANKFAEHEKAISSKIPTDDAYTLPIFMSKKWFMAVNGWDVAFGSPFVVDLDFFLKLQLMWNLEFRRTHRVAFYHFGSRSTKKRADGETGWNEGEKAAAEQFKYKWGIYPYRLTNNRVNMPEGVKGIQ